MKKLIIALLLAVGLSGCVGYGYYGPGVYYHPAGWVGGHYYGPGYYHGGYGGHFYGNRPIHSGRVR